MNRSPPWADLALPALFPRLCWPAAVMECSNGRIGKTIEPGCCVKREAESFDAPSRLRVPANPMMMAFHRLQLQLLCTLTQ